MRPDVGKGVCFFFAVLFAILFGGVFPGVSCAAQQPAPYRLTLQDAIHKALAANLNVLVAGTRVEEAEGTRLRRLSAALLPRRKPMPTCRTATCAHSASHCRGFPA